MLLSVSIVRSAEVDVDEIVREVNAKKLVVVFGELELCKQAAMDTLSAMAKEHPEVAPTEWSTIGYRLDFENFETAIAKHYAADFTVDELKHLVSVFSAPVMRGLVYWVRILATKAPSPEDVTREVERLRKQYGTGPLIEFDTLMHSALGRQLLATQKAAEEIRKRECVAALTDAAKRVQSGR
jgi:hypothetical protein